MVQMYKFGNKTPVTSMNNSFYKSERHPNEAQLVDQKLVTDALEKHEDWNKFLFPCGKGSGRFNCWFLDSNSGKALTGLHNYWKIAVNDYKKIVTRDYHRERQLRALGHEIDGFPMFVYDENAPVHERQQPAARRSMTCPPNP